MAIIFATAHLYARLAAQFGATTSTRAFTVPVRFGRHEATRRDAACPRIVVVPGDYTLGAEKADIGRIVPPRNPGAQPARPLLNLVEYATILVEAVDTTAPIDDAAQYAAVHALYDEVAAVVRRAGRFTIEKTEDIANATLQRRGNAWRVVVSLEAVIPDVPATFAPADVQGSNTPELADSVAAPGESDAFVPDVTPP